MHLADQDLILSATDLSKFLSCPRVLLSTSPEVALAVA
jgi:hypothetical protein